MLLCTLGTSLLANLLAGREGTSQGRKVKIFDKVQLEILKKQLKQVRIFNASSSFPNTEFRNAKVL